MKTKTFIIAILLLAATILATAAFAQEPKEVAPAPEGPKQVDFHIIPAVGAGLFFEASGTAAVSNNGYFLVRVPAIVVPSFFDLSAGLQVEVSNAPNIEYAVLNYARFNFTDHVYAGANVRFWRGGGGSTEYALRASPVVGFRLLTLGGHIPLFLEAEFLDDQSPVKAALIITWETK